MWPSLPLERALALNVQQLSHCSNLTHGPAYRRRSGAGWLSEVIRHCRQRVVTSAQWWLIGWEMVETAAREHFVAANITEKNTD
jgi:hypothetical protein